MHRKPNDNHWHFSSYMLLYWGDWSLWKYTLNPVNIHHRGSLPANKNSKIFVSSILIWGKNGPIYLTKEPLKSSLIFEQLNAIPADVNFNAQNNKLALSMGCDVNVQFSAAFSVVLMLEKRTDFIIETNIMKHWIVLHCSAMATPDIHVTIME